MTTIPINTDFSTLLSAQSARDLLRQLASLVTDDIKASVAALNNELRLTGEDQAYLMVSDKNYDEYMATEWLILVFNTLFAAKNTQLVRGHSEPEYFPATINTKARIEFAHGFFASALHEISHWCIAGYKRRQLADFGYWYAPDGRSAAQQHAFERVEIKPQAIECLLTLACKRSFQVSQDNLFADFDTSNSTFAADVHQQATDYIAQPKQLPNDAQILLYALLTFFYAS